MTTTWTLNSSDDEMKRLIQWFERAGQSGNEAIENAKRLLAEREKQERQDDNEVSPSNPESKEADQ